MVRDGIYDSGKVIITFSNILRNNAFPLANILKTLLEIGQREMNNQVEIEFAASLDVPQGQNMGFNFLQIRPIVETQERHRVKVNTGFPEKSIIISHQALGNGVIDNIRDLIYVKPDSFNPVNTKDIAEIIDRLNSQFVARQGNYILVGPGRWGSADPWLGIPVKWAQISGARLIVEAGMKNFHIDPSQGTHFFQNLTSFNVGYFTINPFIGEGYYDLDFLNKHKAAYEDQFVRHLKFTDPVIIKIDGSKKAGIVLKPEK